MRRMEFWKPINGVQTIQNNSFKPSNVRKKTKGSPWICQFKVGFLRSFEATVKVLHQILSFFVLYNRIDLEITTSLRHRTHVKKPSRHCLTRYVYITVRVYFIYLYHFRFVNDCEGLETSTIIINNYCVYEIIPEVFVLDDFARFIWTRTIKVYIIARDYSRGLSIYI